MRAAWFSTVIPLTLATLVACGDDKPPAQVDAPVGDDDDAPMIDGPPGDAGDPTNPQTLADTGLCADPGCTQINPGIFEYAPQFPLWSDGATKRRWVQLPAGTQIDTSDMNYWKFPVGTRFWKEFTRDGVRCETRYIIKLHDEADTSSPPWFYVSFQWGLDQMSTTPVTQGAQNVNGTGHDIPSRALCRSCHDGLRGPNRDRGRVLGFQAVQLDVDDPDDAHLDLGKLVTMNLLTAAPAGTVSPFFPMGFTATEKAAFGYVHANCSHCHNPTSTTHDTVSMDLRLDTTKLATATGAPTYMTTVNVTPERSYTPLPNQPIVNPHDPANSVMIHRMNNPDFSFHMPQAGSEIVDPMGQTVLTSWINALP